MPEDWKEVERYVQRNGLMLLVSPSPAEKLRVVSSINSSSNSEFTIHKYYTALKTDEDKIIQKFVKAQNYYTIDESNSPVVELPVPFYQNHLEKLNRGRLYYTKEFYLEKTFAPKENQFLNMANDLFKWFRKTFRTDKLDGYEDFIISPSAFQFHQNGGILLLNPELSTSIPNKEKVLA